jgi:hypothetical protein
MFIEELIAPCGMNCGICIAYFGYTVNGKKRKHTCTNCRTRSSLCAFIKKHCDKLADDQYKYCFECEEFPCENLKKIDNRYRKKYEMSMIENLDYIQKNGIKKFIEKEEKRWKCSTCGEAICVHNKICYTCKEKSRKNTEPR